MKNTIQEIGNKLKDARTKCGLTQGRVEKLIGINKTQLSYYETGKREISITVLEKLAQLYGYSLEYFLMNKNMEEPKTKIAFKGEELNDNDLAFISFCDATENRNVMLFHARKMINYMNGKRIDERFVMPISLLVEKTKVR